MNLFAPERPEITPGRKALLIDGSAIPSITVTVRPYGFEVSAQLREYESGEVFSYRHYSALASDISYFFKAFQEDPEGTLFVYFKWHPQNPTRQTKHRPVAATLDFGPSAETLL